MVLFFAKDGWADRPTSEKMSLGGGRGVIVLDASEGAANPLPCDETGLNREGFADGESFKDDDGAGGM